ncbi:MAG TPA: hypothetical protein VIJ23_01840 [Mycobacterium sp.]
MTSTIDIGTAASARVLSARTRAAYAGDWALFTDHCAVDGSRALPADPQSVVDFLNSCPAAPATRRRRVAAIDHHHTATGYARPGESMEKDREAVQAALRGLPSHGWTQGMFGRRDRCVVVLSLLAGVPYRHLATLTAGDIHIEEGVATIRSAAGEWTLRPADDAILCGPCARNRAPKTIARALKKAAVIDHRSPHVCGAGSVLGEATRGVPLLPPIDQWGALPLPLQRLAPHSLSRRVRDLLAADLGAHRNLPVDPRPGTGHHRSGETAGHRAGGQHRLRRGGRGRGMGSRAHRRRTTGGRT